jgi:hypothetical protein
MPNNDEARSQQFDEYPRIRAYLYQKDKEEGKEFLRGIMRKQTIDTREEYVDVLMAFGKVLPFKDEDPEILEMIAKLEKIFPSLTDCIPAPHSWWCRLLELEEQPEHSPDGIT